MDRYLNISNGCRFHIPTRISSFLDHPFGSGGNLNHITKGKNMQNISFIMKCKKITNQLKREICAGKNPCY